MERLEVSGAVRPLYRSLGVKGLSYIGQTERSRAALTGTLEAWHDELCTVHVAQRRMVVGYRRFGKYRCHLQGPSDPRKINNGR